MNIATKRKLKFCVGMVLMLICWCLCLMGFFFSGGKGIAISAVICLVASFVSQIAFGYIPPDPKDAFNFAKGTVERVKEELIEIRLGQLNTDMRLEGRSRSFRREERKKYRLFIEEKTITIDEIMGLIERHIPKE